MIQVMMQRYDRGYDVGGIHGSLLRLSERLGE